MKVWQLVLATLAAGLMSVPASAATLAAHWDFNDGSGSVLTDVSGNGHDTNLSNTVTWVSEGGGYSYIDFDGTGNPIGTLPGDPNWYGQVSADPNTLDLQMETAGSVEAWYRADTFQSAIISLNRGGGAPSLAIGNETTGTAGNIAGALGNTGGPSFLGGIGNVAAPLGAWTHVVLTWDATAGHARLYVNGVLAGSEAVLSFTPELSFFDSKVGLAPYGSPNFYFDGDIDEIKFWGGELTAAEVLAAFQAGRAVPEPASMGLVGAALLVLARRRRA